MRKETQSNYTMENASSSSVRGQILSVVHDSIQRTGYAEVSESEAARLDQPDCPEHYRHYAFVRLMFEQGYAVAHNQEDYAFTVINEPEVGK